MSTTWKTVRRCAISGSLLICASWSTRFASADAGAGIDLNHVDRMAKKIGDEDRRTKIAAADEWSRIIRLSWFTSIRTSGRVISPVRQ